MREHRCADEELIGKGIHCDDAGDKNKVTESRETRYIILMRHGERTCSHEKRLVGIVEDPLTQRGILQAQISGQWLKQHGPRVDKVFASPLQRCIDTAAAAAEPLGFRREDVLVANGLHEIDLGRWENLLLSEAKAADPAAYAAWQEHLGRFVFPGGESFEQAGIRFGKTLDQIRKEHGGNLLVVAHAGVIRSYITQLRGIDVDRLMEEGMNYAGMAILTDHGGEERPVISRRGFIPEERLDDAELQELYRKYGTPENVIRHMQAVARKTDEICRILEEAGAPLRHSDDEINLWPAVRLHLHRAALVHDLLRTEKDHEKASAAALRREGFDRIAELVLAHNDGEIDTSGEALSPAEILYYADKVTDGEKTVTVEERFAASRQKCVTREAEEAWRKRFERAREIRGKIRKYCAEPDKNDKACADRTQESGT